MCALSLCLASISCLGVPGAKENVQVPYGFELQESSTENALSCAQLCENYTSHVQGADEQDCEVWTYISGLCTLRQLTGTASISHVGDMTAVSWKRHANFRDDCTPLVWPIHHANPPRQSTTPGQPTSVTLSSHARTTHHSGSILPATTTAKRALRARSTCAISLAAKHVKKTALMIRHVGHRMGQRRVYKNDRLLCQQGETDQ